MKTKTERSTLSYEPENITKAVTIDFNRPVRADNVIVGGEVKKNGEDAGRVDYNKSNDSITVYLKPASKLTDEEVAAIFKKVPECLKEILGN